MAHVPVERAYWWFPALNAVVGATLTIGAVWGLVSDARGLLGAIAGLAGSA
ncbi:MAG: hypothetical protein ABEJ86_03850 [Halococcoides sp.]